MDSAPERAVMRPAGAKAVAVDRMTKRAAKRYLKEAHVSKYFYNIIYFHSAYI